MEDERRYCSICHCELDDSDDYEVEGQQLCESCFEEHTTTCSPYSSKIPKAARESPTKRRIKMVVFRDFSRADIQL